MADIVERLSQYNPPDRTIDAQRQMSVDIHEAADEITRLREQLHLAEVARAAQVEGLTQGAAGWRERANQLEAQVAALEVDAGRYREWKRAFREGECALWNALCEGQSDAEHDAAIDAALAARKGEA